MNEQLALVLAGLAGCGLGTLFFGGLWWTVRKGLFSKRPVFWFLGSVLLRTGIVLAGFYLISGGQWKQLLACLFGFLIARFMVTLRVRSLPCPQPSVSQAGRALLAGQMAEQSIFPAQEASHAPESR